ncbi:MAG: DMT family transporter [Rhizobiaceae bacterium]|nr:DMT family transporter [Rhizobiaceae bacterium]
MCAALAWSVYNVAAKYGALEGFMPQDSGFVRFTFGGLLMLPIALRMGLGDMGGVGWSHAIPLALFGGPIFVLLINTGFVLSPLSHGVIIPPAASMLSSLFLGYMWLGETITTSRIVGAAILIVAQVIIVLHTLGGDGGELVWLGDLALAGAGFCWGLFTFFVSKWKVDALRGTAALTVISAAIYVPIYLFLAGIPDLPVSSMIIQGMIHGGLSGVVGLFAYAAAVRHLGAGRSGLFPSIVPAVSIVISIPVLNQIPNGLEIFAAVLSFAGIVTGLGVTTMLLRVLRR